MIVCVYYLLFYFIEMTLKKISSKEDDIEDFDKIIDEVINEFSKRRKLLSIDIGRKNLGYSIILYDQSNAISDLDISFGIYTIDDLRVPKDIVTYRCEKIKQFFDNLNNDHSLTDIVIERQVPTNTIAMELMYCIVSTAINAVGSENVHIFDPKLKFSYIKEEYTTANKQHKKASIQYAKNVLSKQQDTKNLALMNSHSKKDDIADSLNQGLVWLSLNKKINCEMLILRQLMIRSDN